MTLLSYDSTFEGFLTAVFEIYEFKYSNPKIIKKDDLQQNLFADAIEIITDNSKSDRVIKKLNAQLSVLTEQQAAYVPVISIGGT